MSNRISYRAVPAEDTFQNFCLVADETCRFANSERKPFYVCSASVTPSYSTGSGITPYQKGRYPKSRGNLEPEILS